MKNLTPKPSYKNRHTDGLPSDGEIIEIIVTDAYGDDYHICEWLTASENEEGRLGTARVVEREHRGIGFHLWENNNSEFVYYRSIK